MGDTINLLDDDEIRTALEEGGELRLNSEGVYLSASSSHVTIRVAPEGGHQYFRGGAREIKILLTDKEVAFQLKPKRMGEG